MNKYLILCVDDEPEVLNSVLQDLAIFEENFIVEGAESVDEAKRVGTITRMDTALSRKNRQESKKSTDLAERQRSVRDALFSALAIIFILGAVIWYFAVMGF